MDLESECSVLESVQDNEEIANDCVLENMGNISVSKALNNGSCVAENNDNDELFPELKQRGAEVSGYVGSPPMDLKPEVSPFSTSLKKGFGLRKWRRIRRDADRDGESSIDSGKMVAQDLSNSGVNPSKRMQYAERRQKSEGSFSSTNAVVRNLDGFVLLDDSGLGLDPPFATGTDSENSEDRSSKSSTAASAPKAKYEMPVFMGFPREMSRMRNLSGKNLAHTVQHGQKGNGRIESTKKARGERVKIEKENSHSSMESDSRSSNFVFMQGTSVNNGIRNERSNDYDEENSDEVVGGGHQDNDGHRGCYDKDGEGGFEGMPCKHVGADSSWGGKERSENNGSSREHDPIEDSMFGLQFAQEALEKELLKLQEIRIDSVSDLCTEFTSSEQSHDGEGLQSSSRPLQSEVVETANGDVRTELEDIFKQKVETEVEYLIISRMVQKLRATAMDQAAVLEEQKAMASEQTQILDKLGDAENKAELLKKDAEKLEKFCKDITSADEILMLQKSVRKYSSSFLIQLVLLVVILSFFLFEFSPTYVEVVPT